MDSDATQRPFAAARDFIRWVQTQELSIVNDDNERRRRRSENYHEDVKRNLDNPAQVLPELIQNADDIDVCNEVTIELTSSTLRVMNDGRPMTCREVDTLCAVGDSTKQDPRFIGHFGRGFKSVFSVSDTPQVRSGWFRFSFSKDQMTVPRPFEDTEAEYLRGTEVTMPLSDSLTASEREQLESRLDTIHRLLPYLRNVSTIVVITERERHRYERESVGDHRLRIRKDGEKLEQRAVFTTEERPTDEALSELAAKRDIEDTERIRNAKVPVTLSFRVDSTGTPQPETETSRLFNFLPTQEEPGLPFDIQADFLLKADRENLTSPSGSYNQWLLGRVGGVFRRIIEYYRGHADAPVGHLTLLHELLSVANYPKYIQSARDSILEAVTETPSIPTEDDGYRRPADVVVPTGAMERLLTRVAIVDHLSLSVSFPHHSVATFTDTLLEAGVLRSFDVPTFFEQADEATVAAFRELSPGELLLVAATLEEYWDEHYRHLGRFHERVAERERLLSTLRKTALLPLTDGRTVALTVTASEPVVPPKQAGDQYEVFTDDFLILDLSADVLPGLPETEPSEIVSQARSFYNTVLGLDSLDDETVLDRTIADAFETPTAVDDQVLDQYLRFIFEDKRRWSKAKERVTMQLRVRGSDRYRAPENERLYLPDCYGLSYSMETVLRGVAASFVSEAYLDLTGTDQPERWREFLTTFGVRDRLHFSERPTTDRRFFTDEAELVAELETLRETPPEGWDIPPSQPKGGKYDTWFRRGRRYALSDITPDETFRAVVASLTATEGDTRTQYEQAGALVTMLDAKWETYAEALCRPLYYVTRPSQRYEVERTTLPCRSTLGELLQDSAWFPTRAGTLAPPTTLLVDTYATAGQEPGRYAGFDPETLSLDFESLGIRDRLGLETTVDLLANAASVWARRSPATIRRALREHLDTLRSEITDDADWQTVRARLETARFIYVEGAEPEFRTVDEVVWQGRDLESAYVSIRDEYARHQDLFERLGVADRLTATQYLEYLAGAQWETLTNPERVWRRTVQKLSSAANGLTERSELVAHLDFDPSDGRFLTAAEQVQPVTAIDYYCLNDRLYTELDEETAARTVRTVDGGSLADETLSGLWDLLGFDDLADTAEMEITSVATHAAPGPITAESPLGQLFTVADSYCRTHGDTDAAESLATIARTYTETACSSLHVQYTNGTPITAQFAVDCVIDDSTKRIYRAADPTGEFEFARQLPQALPLRSSQRSELESLLSGAIGKGETYLESYLADQGIRSYELAHRETPERGPPTDKTAGRDATSPTGEATPSEQKEPHSGTATSDRGTENTTARQSGDTAPSQQQSPTTGDTPHQSPSTSSESPTEETVASAVTESADTADEKRGGSAAPTSSGGAGESESRQSSPTNFDVAPGEAADAGLTLREELPEPSPQHRSSGGTGRSSSSGGRTATEYGKWGEDTTFQWLSDVVRERLEADSGDVTETNEWRPLLEGGYAGSLQCPACDKPVPGRQFDTATSSVRLLHVREHDHGADILLDGASLSRTGDTAAPLEIEAIGPEHVTWVEVKTTGGNSRSFELSLNEYLKAREHPDAYYFLRLCGAGTEPSIDAIISDIESGVADETINITEQSFRLTY